MEIRIGISKKRALVVNIARRAWMFAGDAWLGSAIQRVKVMLSRRKSQGE